ncbi:MerR family transcriptional regulator [Ornithinimicrobium sp. Arc0846-15]|nr:MerR family transcriptional regulator [Ornithinimicrobium laminariae]
MAETTNTNLMTIGRFSSLTRLSVRMLRHYDSHGVLVPADIDQWTGYRRYAPHQLADAADIRNLRDVGFGVSAIGILLAARGTEAWANALQLQRESLGEELNAAQGRVSLITRLLDQGEHNMSITLSRKTVPAMTVVSMRGTVPAYNEEGQLWGQMMPLVGAQGIQPVGPCGVIEHDEQFTERDVDLSIFLPVSSGASVDGPLEVIELPERDCLVAQVKGSFEQISEAHDLINARIADEGLATKNDGTVSSKHFNLYLTNPGEVSEDEQVTEVYLPLA